jgi:ribosome-associated protein
MCFAFSPLSSDSPTHSVMQLSRSEQKRRIKEIEQLVKELVGLPKTALANLPCDPDLLSYFQEAQTMKGGARKRQLKYLTKLLKDEPLQELYGFLLERKGSNLAEKSKFHELEYLRDRLLDEAINKRKVLRSSQMELPETWSGEAIAEITVRLPGIDAIALSRLSSIFARTRQIRHSREIFRLLKGALISEDR